MGNRCNEIYYEIFSQLPMKLDVTSHMIQLLCDSCTDFPATGVIFRWLDPQLGSYHSHTDA